MLSVLEDPFFWALMSMFALVAAGALVSGTRLGSYRRFGVVVVALFLLGRVILVLPSCPQPRFELGGLNWAIGTAVFIIGVAFCAPALRIRPFTAPHGELPLRTTGLYGIVRHPIYLGEVLWCLGWAILFGSAIGVVLVPFWWAGLSFITLIEEKSLEREIGEPYAEYKARVPSGIIPGFTI
jgi:protein-S-isoprenylcysteine O-methyltransferase Ste14